MRRYLAILILMFCASCTPANPYTQVGPSTTARCAEDMPCWDCHTMGNHVCGRIGGN